MEIKETGGVPPSQDEADVYDKMLRLEELESLLEELDEASVGTKANLPPQIQDRLSVLGLRDADDLRRQIESLHNRLDRLE